MLDQQTWSRRGPKAMIVSRKFSQSITLSHRELSFSRDIVDSTITRLRKSIEREVELLGSNALLEREDIRQYESFTSSSTVINCTRTYRLSWDNKIAVSPDQIELVYDKKVEDCLHYLYRTQLMYKSTSKTLITIKAMLSRTPVKFGEDRILELKMPYVGTTQLRYGRFDMIDEHGQYLRDVYLTRVKVISPLELLALAAD